MVPTGQYLFEVKEAGKVEEKRKMGSSTSCCQPFSPGDEAFSPLDKGGLPACDA